MIKFQRFVGKQVELDISGKVHIGRCIDLGSDLMVLFYDQRFYYIPLLHVQNIKISLQPDEDSGDVPEEPIDYEKESLSFRKILQHAKGQFVEIYVSGPTTIHGYLTSIMNDYFVFYSPIHKSMFISMNHLKWLVPYHPNLTPYSLSNQSLLVHPVSIALSRTFEEQCKRLEGNLVVFDLGDDPNKIGFLQKMDNQVIELVNAGGERVCWNFQHLKNVYIP
jgi:hypothetical protein